MPVHVAKKIAQVVLGTADAQIYLTPGGTTTTIVAIDVTETSGNARTFRLHHVDASGSSTAGNAIYFDLAIASKRTLTRTAPLFLTAGQMIRGLASAATSITVTINAIETLN